MRCTRSKIFCSRIRVSRGFTAMWDCCAHSRSFSSAGVSLYSSARFSRIERDFVKRQKAHAGSLLPRHPGKCLGDPRKARAKANEKTPHIQIPNRQLRRDNCIRAFSLRAFSLCRPGLRTVRRGRLSIATGRAGHSPAAFRTRRRKRRRSEEHTSELQSHLNLVCRLLLEKKKKKESIANIDM